VKEFINVKSAELVIGSTSGINELRPGAGTLISVYIDATYGGTGISAVGVKFNPSMLTVSG
jgi:hypothetical protein